ncbi:unnamed protein product [Caenorhabditis sp. 36 PRJEB53466]|nr:unnamed protein product [Caenorhabditis sp. 36 PRJEB53466]
MKIVLVLLLAVFTSGYALELVNDAPPGFLDHGIHSIVNDDPDMPGDISLDGNPPIAVTFHDVPEATTKQIFH